MLAEAGAECVYVVQNDDIRRGVAKLAARPAEVFVCDVEHEEQIARLRDELAARRTTASTAWCIRSPSPTIPAA